MPRILRTAISREDYLAIWSYIAQDNMDAANKMVRRFDQSLAMLAEHPNLGRPRYLLSPRLRSYPVGVYVIFYRAIDNGIELIRVLHGNRKHKRGMFRIQ